VSSWRISNRKVNYKCRKIKTTIITLFSASVFCSAAFFCFSIHLAASSSSSSSSESAARLLTPASLSSSRRFSRTAWIFARIFSACIFEPRFSI